MSGIADAGTAMPVALVVKRRIFLELGDHALRVNTAWNPDPPLSVGGPGLATTTGVEP